jgi:eukaryotic-like serine/threonine-protein kinase
MDSQRWALIERHFEQLTALPSTERSAYLERASAGDAELRAELVSLLAAHESQANPLDIPAALRFAGAPTTDSSAAPRIVQPGTQVGPYVLLNKIADGGMGAVWLAERADGLLKRKVALKLPHVSWLSGDFAQRMARERDILSSLEHPNIARLYDAGLDDLGRPYLAMEYIEGQPIDAYVSERSIGIEATLHLILQVAHAVAKAHSHLVVHRDLKPSNILVTPQGCVRLLDFGIAKLLSDSAELTQLTRIGGRVFTPEYAAPEQIKGESISTATDIYSLAVVAYELLSGARPYALTRGTAAELEEAIAGTDPLAASEATPDNHRRRALRGDLDAILNKALKKNPAQRYATVDAFARDIEKYLAGELVSARPDAWTYRFTRFVARHRLAFASGLIIALSLVAATAVSIYQLRRTEQQRQRAVLLGQRHAAVAEFLGTVLTEAAAPESTITVGTLLARSEDIAVSGAVSTVPEDRADILGVIGTYYSSLGDPKKAVDVISRALELVEHSRDRDLVARLVCLRAPSLARLGQVEQAKKHIDEAIETPEVSPEVLADCLRYRAFIAQQTNDPEGAMNDAEQALRQLERSEAPNAIMRAGLVGDLAYAHQLKGNTAQAERHFADSVAGFRAAGRPRHPTLIAILNNWGIARISSGDMRGALESYQEAMEVASATTTEPPTYVVLNYARVLEELADYDRAVEHYQRAIAVADGAGDPLSSTLGKLCLARIEVERGNLLDAVEVLDRIAPMIGSTIPAQSPPGLMHTLLRGVVAARQGDFPVALERMSTIVRFWDDRKAAVGATANALRLRAEVLLSTGHLDEALNDAQRALDISRSLQTGAASSNTGHSLVVLANVQAARGETQLAIQALDEAIPQLATALGPEHPATRRARDQRLRS